MLYWDENVQNFFLRWFFLFHIYSKKKNLTWEQGHLFPLWHLHIPENFSGLYSFLMFSELWGWNIGEKVGVPSWNENKFPDQWKVLRMKSFLRIDEFHDGGFIIYFTDSLNQPEFKLWANIAVVIIADILSIDSV